MKKKLKYLLLIVLIISCSMTGCSLKDNSTEKHDITMKTLSIHALPFVDNESIKRGNKSGEKIEIDMSQVYLDEDYRAGYSRGMVSDYILHDGYMYYLVYYRAEEFVWPNQVVIFRQDIENGMVEYMFHYVYDSSFMTLTGIEYNENLEWFRQDSSETIYHDTLKDGEIITSIPSIEEAYRIDVDTDTSWQNGIKEELLTGDVYLTLDSDEYIVWDQFENPDDHYVSSYINIYNKKNGEYNRIDKEEYGGYFRYAPVAYGNILVFICGQDIKSYTEENDSFSSVYYVELDTMKSHLLVKGSGNVNNVAFKTFDAIKQNDGYIYFELLTNPYSEKRPQDAQPYDTMYIISQ
ncbi:MAG: hypothetical protein K2G45_04240 [Lachnospiraceae bacterium]|nr:hypothetical protein [Lachnospiraceae bacterium]